MLHNEVGRLREVIKKRKWALLVPPHKQALFFRLLYFPEVREVMHFTSHVHRFKT